MNLKEIAYKLVLILLIVSLLTPDYAGNVLAATDTRKALTTGNNDAKPKDVVQPSPTPWNPNTVQKTLEQPVPTPTPTPNMFSVPEAVYSEIKSQLPEGLILSPEEAAAYSSRLSTEDSEQARIDAIEAKYAKPSLKMKRTMTEPSLSKKDIRELMIRGAKIEDIYEIAYLSAETGLDPFELLAIYTKRGLSWDELRHNLKTKGGSTSVTEETYGVTDNVYSKLDDLIDNPISSFSALSVKSASTLDMAISGVIGDFRMEAINQVGKPQYSDRSLSSESVDPASGSLIWKDTQISLPGREGLDLNIGVMYNSNNSEFISDSNISTSSPNARFDLGTGWSFRFPFTDGSYYHDGEGGVYAISYSDEGLEGYTHLKNYKGKDKRFVEDTAHTFSNGQFTSDWYVEYADGKREYFGLPEGNLLGIVDRFGNTITFKYTEIWHTEHWSSKYLLTQIIDSMGRQVDFKYDNVNLQKVIHGQEPLEEKIVVTVKDTNGAVSQPVTYTRARVGYSWYIYHGMYEGKDLYSHQWEGRPSPELRSITKQNGEQIKFNYNKGWYLYNTKTKPDKLNIKEVYTEEAGNELLSSIEYPHSKTVYEMEYQARNMGPYGSFDTPIVKTRYDQVLKSGVYIGRYNETTYSYNGSYDGYKTYYGPDLVPASHTYSSVMHNVADNLSVTRTFNGKGQFLSAVSQAANGEKKVEKTTAFHSLFTQSPTATEIWEYGPGDTDGTANKLYSETSYDEWGNVATVTRPLTESQRNNPTLKARNTTTLTYEPNYRFLSSKSWYASENDSSALTESYTYTAQGRVQSATNAAGETTSFTYQNKNAPDGTSRLYKATSEKRAGGKTVAKSVVTYGEETLYAYPTVEEAYSNIGQGNEQTVKTSTAYDMGTGRVIEKSDGQHATTYAYDAIGRLTKETHPVRTNTNGERYSEVIEYNYYNQTSGNFDSVNAGTEVLKVDSIRTVKNLTNNQELKTYANVLYNGMGLALLEERYDDSNGKWVFTQYHYDELGRPVYSIDPAGNTLSVGYDAWGRQNRATNANGDFVVSDYSLKARTNTSYIQDKNTGEKLNYVLDSYDAWGNKLSTATYKDWPTNQQQITESYRYNIAGNVTGYTDPNHNMNEDGVTTTYAYDALGRLAAVKDALNQTTNYTYDGNGQLAKVTIQAKGGTPQTLNTKTYNELGLLAVKQDGASQSESYSYNSLGQLIGKRDRNGSAFEYAYDESGQLKKSTINGTINNVAQTQETNVIFGKDNPRNQVIQTLTNKQVTATQTQVLDSLGQVRSTYSVAGNHSAFIGNQLDILGRMTQINDGYMGFYTNYQYSKQRLEKVQTNGSSTVTGAASANVQYSYLANNLVKSITYPTLTDNSILKTEYTYKKALGWIESMSNTKGASVLSSYSYGYDNNGNQVTVSELRKGSNTAQTTSYGYDALNRLVSITRPDGGKTTYTYDVRGNRQTLSDTSSVSLDTADTSYTYDLQNTLTSVTKGGNTTSFQYYADGLRYMKTNGNTQTQVNYNLNGQVLSEEKIVGGVYMEQASFVRGDRLLVKKDKKASKDYYYLYNGHGDVVQIVNTSGAIVNNYTYDEWGNITSQVEGISNSFKYTGESYDPETGLYYLRARYYDPSIGRFLNEDTVEGQIDNPLSLNLYTYVVNNPLIYTDPTGHMNTRGVNSIGADDSSYGEGQEFEYFSEMNQIELTQIMGDTRYSMDVRGAAAAEFVKRNFMLVENGGVKAASGVKALINSVKKALTTGEAVKEVKNVVSITRVGQWMSKTEYTEFVKNGVIPRTNVLTKGKDGYIKQANIGDYYVEFDIDSSLLFTKDADLGWSLIKSKNDLHIRAAKSKGLTLPEPIGTNIKHVYTKGE